MNALVYPGTLAVNQTQLRDPVARASLPYTEYDGAPSPTAVGSTADTHRHCRFFARGTLPSDTGTWPW
eukprot:m.969431 g.969431  ORF g.969431 m.969431 type:complete len:68 (-) comp23920_c0_seq3:1655-1858(-)